MRIWQSIEEGFYFHLPKATTAAVPCIHCHLDLVDGMRSSFANRYVILFQSPVRPTGSRLSIIMVWYDSDRVYWNIHSGRDYEYAKSKLCILLGAGHEHVVKRSWGREGREWNDDFCAITMNFERSNQISWKILREIEKQFGLLKLWLFLQ